MWSYMCMLRQVVICFGISCTCNDHIWWIETQSVSTSWFFKTKQNTFPMIWCCKSMFLPVRINVRILCSGNASPDILRHNRATSYRALNIVWCAFMMQVMTIRQLKSINSIKRCNAGESSYCRHCVLAGIFWNAVLGIEVFVWACIAHCRGTEALNGAQSLRAGEAQGNKRSSTSSSLNLQGRSTSPVNIVS